ncbi:hypothetical protein [Magnetospirillum sp. ME-1]|uniref:hypothetical protein n=1 Tax=Magnetospirillum sp. ME-1 TaxID=1639348 RepID=UPI0011AEB55E|nr:hypothetical protein [Magnetospirillum sp. ME-1]
MGGVLRTIMASVMLYRISRWLAPIVAPLILLWLAAGLIYMNSYWVAPVSLAILVWTYHRQRQSETTGIPIRESSFRMLKTIRTASAVIAIVACMMSWNRYAHPRAEGPTQTAVSSGPAVAAPSSQPPAQPATIQPSGPAAATVPPSGPIVVKPRSSGSSAAILDDGSR